MRCREHGVQQVPVPWADAQSRFTALFEVMVIEWLKVASIAAVARRCRLSWDQVAGIQGACGHAGSVSTRGSAAALVGVDETSFQRRLWPAYIRSVREHTNALIAFDKFHLAQHLGAAVDQLRRQEHRTLRQQDDDRLAKTRYLWLTRRGNMTQRQRRAFTPLRTSSLHVARAWTIKECAMQLWRYQSPGWAVRLWSRWYGWAIRSRLEPVKKVARMIRRHWEGVINAVMTDLTNARSESINAKIQWFKQHACGYRNRERFRSAIYFHSGGLDIYPDALAVHTNS